MVGLEHSVFTGNIMVGLEHLVFRQHYGRVGTDSVTEFVTFRVVTGVATTLPNPNLDPLVWMMSMNYDEYWLEQCGMSVTG